MFENIENSIFKKQNAIEARHSLALFLTLIVSILIRIYLSQFDGNKIDVNDFKLWSQAVYNVGITNFYSSVWSDYPPFYIYILWVVGAIYKLFYSSFDIGTMLFTILIKFPANIFDILTALLIFKILKKYTDFKTAYFGMVIYVFNPAIIYNSAIWGQIDSLNTFFILFTIMFIVSDRLELAGISMVIAILTKPQSLVMLPFIAILMVKDFLMVKDLKNQKSKKLPKKLLRLIKVFIISVFIFILLTLPFYLKTSTSMNDLISQITRIYSSGYNQYAYNSVNAFNLWALLGFWRPDNIVILSLSYRIWGYILFSLFFTYIAYIVIKEIKEIKEINIINSDKDMDKAIINSDKDMDKAIDVNKNDILLYFTGGLLFFGFFMFFTRIHERYIFPMFSQLVIVASLDRRLMYVFSIMTFTFLFNLYYILQYLNSGKFIRDGDPYVYIFSIINLGLFIYTLYCFSTFRERLRKNAEQNKYLN